MAKQKERERHHPLVPKKVLRQIRRILQATGITKSELGRRAGGTRNTIAILMRPEKTHRPSTSAPLFAEINRIYHETFPPKPTAPLRAGEQAKEDRRRKREDRYLLRQVEIPKEIARSFTSRKAEIEELEAAAAAITARIQNAKNAAAAERKAAEVVAKLNTQASESIPSWLAEDLLWLTSHVSEIGEQNERIEQKFETLVARIGTLAARLDDGQVRIEVAVASVEEQVEKLLAPVGRDTLFAPKSVNGGTP